MRIGSAIATLMLLLAKGTPAGGEACMQVGGPGGGVLTAALPARADDGTTVTVECRSQALMKPHAPLRLASCRSDHSADPGKRILIPTMAPARRSISSMSSAT